MVAKILACSYSWNVDELYGIFLTGFGPMFTKYLLKWLASSLSFVIYMLLWVNLEHFVMDFLLLITVLIPLHVLLKVCLFWLIRFS